MKCVVCDAEKASYRCRTCRSAYCSSACYKKHRMSKEEAAASSSGSAGEDRETAPVSFDFLCESIVAAQQPERELELKRQRTEAEADVFSDISREKASATSSPRSRLDGTAAAAAAASSSSPSPQPPAQTATPYQDEQGDATAVGAEASSSGRQDSHGEGVNGGSGSGSSGAEKPRLDEGQAEVAADADAVYILQEKHLSALATDTAVRGALRSPALQKLIRTIDSSRSRLDALDAAQYNNADFQQFCNEVMRAIAKTEGR